MTKKQTIEAIQRARESHLSQMEKIDAVINGKKVENPTALAKTECDFGQWLYGDEKQLRVVLGALFFTKLEVMHENWHKEYKRLFDIFFKDEKKGLLSKVFGSSKIDSLEIDKAKLYYSELKNTTDELLKIIASCERKVSAMNDSKFR